MERRVPFYALILAIVGAALIRNTAWAPGKPASQPLSRDSTPTAARVPTSDDAARVRNAHCGAAPEPLKPLCGMVYDSAENNPERKADWRGSAWVERAKARVGRSLIGLPLPFAI